MLGILALVPLIPGSLSESECANLADKWGEMHFQTIRKFMHPESSEEVTIEFCWIVTQDVLQVGPLVTLDAKVQGAHYDKSSTDYEKITITIPDKLLNYRFDSNDARSSEYAQSGELVLHPSSSDTFTSNGMPINIRLIVPDTIYVDYCEYTLDENCFQIDNIIQPAPYFYVGQLEIYDQMSTLNESLELLIILVIILIIIVPVIVLGSKYVKNNSRQ